MADASDVENALVALVGGILYPNGTSAPSITGFPARVYRGFPNSAELDPDLLGGISHVTIAEQPGYTRVAPGYLNPTYDTPGTITLTITAVGPVVTLGGVAGAGQMVGASYGGNAYAYVLTGSDTLTTAATALAALAPGATSAGPVITLNTALEVLARVSAYGTTQTRPRWQYQGFCVKVWAPSPAARDAICSAVDAQMAANYFIPLTDGQGARMEYRSTYSDDVPQREALWKRDLYYTVLYATTITTAAAGFLFGIQNVSPQNAQAQLFGATQTFIG